VHTSNKTPGKCFLTAVDHLCPTCKWKHRNLQAGLVHFHPQEYFPPSNQNNKSMRKMILNTALAIFFGAIQPIERTSERQSLQIYSHSLALLVLFIGCIAQKNHYTAPNTIQLIRQPEIKYSPSTSPS
jgi:hypothetical protein